MTKCYCTYRRSFKIKIKHIKKTKNNYNDLKTLLTHDVNPFIVSETGRRPLILPIFMDIKK